MLKEQLMASKLPKRNFFLDTPGAQGSHPKTDLPNIGKTRLCPLKLIGSSDFAQLFFKSLVLMMASKIWTLSISAPSITAGILDKKLDKKLELRILISHFGNPQIPNQACVINVPTLD
jgi:hypothetical protein